MIARDQRIEDVIMWDIMCGTADRSHSKIMDENVLKLTVLGPFRVSRPCIYMFLSVVLGGTRTKAVTQQVTDVTLLHALHNRLRYQDGEINFVTFEIQVIGEATCRKMIVTRAGVIQIESKITPIRRS